MKIISSSCESVRPEKIHYNSNCFNVGLKRVDHTEDLGMVFAKPLVSNSVSLTDVKRSWKTIRKALSMRPLRPIFECACVVSNLARVDHREGFESIQKEFTFFPFRILYYHLDCHKLVLYKYWLGLLDLMTLSSRRTLHCGWFRFDVISDVVNVDILADKITFNDPLGRKQY